MVLHAGQALLRQMGKLQPGGTKVTSEVTGPPELSGSLPAAWHKKQGGVGEATMWLSCREG